MTTILEIPLRNISPSAIEDLQAQYPNATLRIEAENETAVSMDEAQFWSIIAAFDWRTRNTEAILAPIELEDEYVKAYKEKYGENPPGNV